MKEYMLELTRYDSAERLLAFLLARRDVVSPRLLGDEQGGMVIVAWHASVEME